MTYTVEMGYDVMIYIPLFIDWFEHSKVNGAEENSQPHGHTNSMEIS
jgi:hypothetical protein